MVTPADHANTVREEVYTDGCLTEKAHYALDALVAQAERWQEIEHPFDQSEYDAMFARAEAAEQRATDMEKAIWHVVNDSPGTPESVKEYLRRAAAVVTDGPDATCKACGKPVRYSPNDTHYLHENLAIWCDAVRYDIERGYVKADGTSAVVLERSTLGGVS